MRLAHTLETRQTQTQRIDPRQILASEILTWTTTELESAVERELAENPALEVKEGETIVDPAAPAPPPPTPAAESERFLPAREAVRDDLGDDDPMERVASGLSLADHLRAQVGQVADGAACQALVRRLIEHVDERGYLGINAAEIAASAKTTLLAVEGAVRALQLMDPPGVGARDLPECLRLQAEYLEQIGEGNATATRLLAGCWEDLVTRREARIASRLRVCRDDVQGALAFIQRALTPYPGRAFRPPWESRGPTQQAIRSDIVFKRTEAGFVVEMARDFENIVTLAPLWKKLAERPESGSGNDMRRYIRDHVERAEGFLNGLARRGRTLRSIAGALTHCQQGYLETGDRAFLRPLTRATLSQTLNLDESVISRAVADKWAQLPGGEVVPLDAFFGNAHAVRDALVDLIAAENPAKPLSDDEIADALTRQGFPLARRTVAKYRGLEKILPARLRKRT